MSTADTKPDTARIAFEVTLFLLLAGALFVMFNLTPPS